MVASELKRCPFCGGKAKLAFRKGIDDWAKVYCTKCGVNYIYEKPEQAIAAWNRRAGEGEK